MKLKVELQAYLQQYSPNDQSVFDLEMPDGATVGDVVAKLGVPPDHASIIIVSEALADASTPLKDGDHVTVVPPLAGG